MSERRVSNLSIAQYITVMEPNPQPNTQYTAPNSLPIRKLKVDLSQGFGRHWFGGDAFRTAYYNALSMSFPEGEQRFIDSVQACAKMLPEEPRYSVLREQVRDFCAQEATHRHMHAQYNAQLEKQGLVNAWEPRIVRRFSQAAHINPLHHLALTAGFEHYTAVLSQILLERPQMLDGAEPTMRQVWMWHCMEETEHKAVAFDLYQAVSASYRWRVRWFLFVTIIFATDLLRQTTNNLWHDRTLFKPSTWWSALKFFLGRPGTKDRPTGNGILWLATGYLVSYFRRDFHPWQHDNQAQASNYARAHGTEWRVVR
jgi:uncharacterized protein